jgi:pyrimidine-specific ribonucleoside hydrolase
MMLASSVSEAQTKPVLLDVDPGIDDALAILLALRSPELSVEGITVVAGNVEVDLGLQNALKIVELAGRSDIPVARGADTPLRGRLVTSRHVHGDNGLGNIELPKPNTQSFPGNAVELIASKIEEHAGKITLIPVGPLTNIALALKFHPQLAPKIKEIVLMGGSLSGGNITPAAEFNIFNDPEAADMVFRSGVPIVMVGLDVTERTVLKPHYLEGVARTANPINQLVWGFTDFHLNGLGSGGIMLHDPLAVGVVIDPGFVTTRSLHVGVETKGEKTRGETVAARKGYFVQFQESRGTRTVVGREKVSPNAAVCLDVASDRFVKFFVERVLEGGDGS